MHNSFHVAVSSEGKWQINVFAEEHLAPQDNLLFDMTETGVISIHSLFNSGFKWTVGFICHMEEKP